MYIGDINNLDIDDIVADKQEEKTEIEKEIEEETTPAGLDDIDLFDDFGDFDE